VARIVTTAYRPKRPPRKRKAVAVAGPAIVRKVKAAALPTGGKNKPAAANDDRPEAKLRPDGRTQSAIVTTTSRKRAKLLRAERAAEPEATARVRAFFDRMIRPGGPAR
jgi:hypothetical protein